MAKRGKPNISRGNQGSNKPKTQTLAGAKAKANKTVRQGNAR
jgi:hypothetical protein